MSLIVIGIDPGPTTGIAFAKWTAGDAELEVAPRFGACQVDADSVPLVMGALTGKSFRTREDRVVIGMEAWSEGRVRGEAARITKDLIEHIRTVYGDMSTRIQTFAAADHKVWNRAGDRLAQTDLSQLTHRMVHARDAGRVLLYTAVRYEFVPDPLSRVNEPKKWWRSP